MPAASVKVHTRTDSPKAERRPRYCERRSCRSPYRHDDLAGYHKGCRSFAARAAASAYEARRQAEGPRRIDGTGTARRLQALHALGWSDTMLAERLGVVKQRVQALRRQQRTTVVLRSTAEDVAWLYLELSEADPPPGPAAERTRREAARAGEQPPEAWDPDSTAIDDPEAEPYAWRPTGWAAAAAASRERRSRERRERMAEVRDLERAGLTIEQTARSLGVSARTVHRYRAELLGGEKAA